MIRTYSELIKLPTFEERLRYCQVRNRIGLATFGSDRYLNQGFYKSKDWRLFRDHVIARDLGMDLAHHEFPIVGKIYIHHLNPITEEDILKRTDYLMHPEYAVCVSFQTHQAIHYADLARDPPRTFTERAPNDTCPWKR